MQFQHLPHNLYVHRRLYPTFPAEYLSLKFSNKEAAARLEKLLRSAIANWEAKNDRKAESGELYISTIFVDPAPMLKRLRTAPQGRGYRIRKRANHVTLVVDTIDKDTTIKD